MTKIRERHRYVRRLSYTIVREGDACPAYGERIDSPLVAARLTRCVIPDDGREHFVIFMLSSQNHLQWVHEVSVGSLSSSIVHPREVLGPAIREGAAHLILAHNHPSGDPTPSKEDVLLTRQLMAGAKLLGVIVHDHVVIGNGSEAYASLSEHGLMS